MFARISIRLPDSEQVVVVPRTAIQYAPYGNSVYVITEQEPAAEEVEGEGSDADKQPTLIVKRRFVRTGNERGDLVAVTDGLQAGEKIATSGLLKLRNDATVIINNEIEPSSEIDPRPDNS
jgi:membrane fusion protein, multidrug efflux system